MLGIMQGSLRDHDPQVTLIVNGNRKVVGREDMYLAGFMEEDQCSGLLCICEVIHPQLFLSAYPAPQKMHEHRHTA